MQIIIVRSFYPWEKITEISYAVFLSFYHLNVDSLPPGLEEAHVITLQTDIQQVKTR